MSPSWVPLHGGPFSSFRMGPSLVVMVISTDILQPCQVGRAHPEKADNLGTTQLHHLQEGEGRGALKCCPAAVCRIGYFVTVRS